MLKITDAIDLEIAGRVYPLIWCPDVIKKFKSETGKHPISLFSQVRKDLHLAAYKGDLGTGSATIDAVVMASLIANVFNPDDASRLLYYAANAVDGAVTFEEIQDAVYIEGICPEIKEKNGVKIYTYPFILQKYMHYCLGIKTVQDEEDQKKTSGSSQP